MIDYTRARLVSWGRWCGQPERRLWYKPAASFVNANTGDRSAWEGRDMPPDVAEVEEAVNRMSAHLRSVVRENYCTRGPKRLKAWRLLITVDTYKRRLDIAEHFVDREIG